MRKSFKIPLSACLLLSVGELNTNKNHEIVIRALEKLHNPDVHYAIAGKGELKEHLLDLAKNLNVSEQVHLLGFCKDIKAIYKISDIFIFPSIREGLGLSAIEAMAAGLPMITSNNRGSQDYAQNMVNAIVCDAHNVNEYVEAIQKLIGDRYMRTMMKKANTIKARQYDISIVNRRMREIYSLFTEK